MQYPYKVSELIPLSQSIDADGDTHAIYALPAPKNWVFKTYHDEDYKVYSTSTHAVTKIRVVLFIDEDGIPSAVVVPFEETGEESTRGSLSIKGVLSIVGVLEQLGFTPALASN